MGKKIMFLDLEGTVIEDIFNPKPINVDIIKAHIEKHQPDEIHIFTFALDSEEEKQKHAKLFEHLEDLLGVKFNKIWISTDIIKQCLKITGIHLALFELKLIFGKMRSFHEFCKSMPDSSLCILIDDTVEDTTFINHTTEQTLITIHI